MPLIAQQTIDQTLDRTDIVDVIGEFVKLKKTGSSYQGLSPFTDEKTPSFYVIPSKNIYKDFSSGLGGSVLHFIQELKKLSFPDAIKFLAERASVEIEYEKEDEKAKEKRESREYSKKLYRAANLKYIANRKALSDDHQAINQLSRIDDDSLIEWQIGYTSDEGNFIYQHCSEKGIVQDAHTAGLLSQKNGQYYDFLRKRITIPIYDHNDQLVGFSGRVIDDSNPKYLHTKSFEKDRVLYGMNKAKQMISKTGIAYLTEGFMDVIGLHEIELFNTVCSMGTSLSSSQCLLLKRYAKEIHLLRDGDQAGIKAAIRDMETLLQEGLKISITLLPEGKDPYDLAHDPDIDNPAEWIKENKQDALVYFSEDIYQTAGDDPFLKADAINAIATWLNLIEDFVVKDAYLGLIAKKLKIKVGDLKKKQMDFIDIAEKKGYESIDFNIPDEVDQKDALRYGFYELVNGPQTGYYFRTGEHFINKSNFVITPIFHNYDTDENARIIKIEDGIDSPEYVEMPGDAMISLAKFKQFVFEKGPYQFRGNAIDLEKIVFKILRGFSKAYPLKTLGWQSEGFFAYYNCIFNGTLGEYNQAGLVKHENKYYFSPGSSEIYKDLREDDDQFENDKFLAYMKTQLNFSEWSKLIFNVYGDHAFAGVPFVLVSLFRDIVFKVDNNVPFLYCYGQSKSGKSKFAESIMNLFFKEMPAFNLNAGTDFAFANRLARFRNCPVFLNEFDDSVVKDEWFQSIKGAYDGEGRERGKGGSKKKTEIQRVNCTLILVGQYLSTKDDNSVLSRSMLRSFRLMMNRPESQQKAYEELKDLEKKGLSSILTELLPHRAMVEKKYNSTFSERFKIVSAIMRGEKKQYEERVLRNYCALGTMVYLFKDLIKFPWTYEQYERWIIDEIHALSLMISESDILVDFWTTISTLFDQGIIRHNREFVVRYTNEVRIDVDRKPERVSFETEKPILYIRMAEIQKYYAKEKRKEGGHPIDKTSLITYLKNREYFIGRVDSQKINGRNYSCYVFEMEGTGINLSIEDNPQPEPEPTPTNSNYESNKNNELDEAPF